VARLCGLCQSDAFFGASPIFGAWHAWPPPFGPRQLRTTEPETLDCQSAFATIPPKWRGDTCPEAPEARSDRPTWSARPGGAPSWIGLRRPGARPAWPWRRRPSSPACARSHFPAGLYPLARRAPNEGIAAARRAGPAVGLFADVLFAAMRRRRSATGSPRRERAQESARRALASLLSPCFARKIRLVHLMPEPLRPGPGRPLPAFRKWLVIRPIQGQDRRYFPKLKHWPLRSADAWR